MYGQEKMQEDLDMALVEEMMFSEEGTTLAAAPDTVSLLRAEPLPAPAAPPVVGNGPRGREERGKRGGERGEAGWGVREVERGGNGDGGGAMRHPSTMSQVMSHGDTKWKRNDPKRRLALWQHKRCREGFELATLRKLEIMTPKPKF